MPKHQSSYPRDIRTYNKGSKIDLENELLASSEGSYLDAHNMRPTSMDGDSGSLKKIKGEQSLLPLINNKAVPDAVPDITQYFKTFSELNLDYCCIGLIEVNNNIVDFFANKNGTDSLIRVNGMIVLWDKDASESDKIGFSCEHHLQMDKDDSCDFGTVFVTDNNVEPIYFEIKTLLENAGLIRNGILTVKVDGYYDSSLNFIKSRPTSSFVFTSPTQAYFIDFKRDILDISSESGLDIPVFVGLTDSPSGGIISGNNGLPVGVYQYSIRYVNKDGERTQWSHSTGLIPMPAVLSDDNKYYSSPLTEGGSPDVSVGFNAVHLKIRVTNDFGLDSLEIRRISYNSGDILGSESGQEIISRIDISGLKKSEIVNFYDNGGVPIETLSGEDSLGNNNIIERAKGIRFHNNRIYLMNVKESSRDVDAPLSKDFNEDTPDDNKIEIGSTIQKIYKEAYNNPKSFESYKHYLSREGYKLGFVGYDVNGEISFVKGLGGYQMPDRRDELSGDSLKTSYRGSVEAINNNRQLSNTHEVFDHYRAVKRKNIHDKGINHTESSIDIEGHYTENLNSQLLGSSLKREELQSINQNEQVYDINRSRYNPLVQAFDYNPECFGLDYYSKGMYVKGIDNLDDPRFKKIKSFSIVRTDSVNNLVAQGIGVYNFKKNVSLQAGFQPDSKNKKSIIFYSPDTDGKLSIDPLLAEKIKRNPSNYKIEISSPLGFFSDVYNHFPAFVTTGNTQVSGSVSYEGNDRLRSSSLEPDINVDQLLFARILRDKNGVHSKINPMELNIGRDFVSSDGDTYGYVDFGKWRGDQNTSSVDDKTKRTIDISGIKESDNSDGLIIELENNIYDYEIGTNNNFIKYSEPLVKNFHEPFYIINIVRKTDSINLDIDDNDSFQETGTYIKKESVIGATNGLEQSLELTYERWEDVSNGVLSDERLEQIKREGLESMIIGNFGYYDIGNTSTGIGYNYHRRYIYVGGQAWINSNSFNTVQEYNTAVLEIFNNGEYLLPNTVDDDNNTIAGQTVYGIYHTSTKDNNFFNVVFKKITNGTGHADKVFIPSSGKDIVVRYNSNIPIRVFGGDGHIGENIFNMINKPTFLGTPMPYPSYLNHDRILVETVSSNLQPSVADRIFNIESRYRVLSEPFSGIQVFNTSVIRQMAVMFCCESRTNTNFLYSKNEEGVKRDGFFPNLNIDPSFEERFSQDPINASIPTNPSINQDYSTNSLFRKYFKSSDFIDNVTEFCSKIVWSLPKNPSQQDTPNLRTFPALNFYSLPESTGEIKKAWNTLTGRGENLYAITENGTALLLTNKRNLQGAEGNDLTFIGDENNGVLDHLWVSQSIGMNKEFWRTHAEYEGTLYWANNESVYKFDGNKIDDIGKAGYHSRIYIDYLSKLNGGFNSAGELAEQMTGHYDRYHNEYWLTFNGYKDCPENIGEAVLDFTNGSIPDAFTLAYSELTNSWLGTYGYNFNKYVSIDNKSYGFKENSLYELNIGNTINNNPIASHVLGFSVASQMRDKEFSRIRVNSSDLPTSIQFFKELSGFKSASPLNSLLSTNMKNHYGYEQYIPRELVSRNRIQGRILLFDIINTTDENFKVIDTEVVYKVLK